VCGILFLVAAVSAGVVPTYPITPIAKISAPLPYAAPRLAYTAPVARPPAYLAQAPALLSHASPLPVAYSPQAPVFAKQYAPQAPVFAKQYTPQVAYAAPIKAIDTDYDPNPSYSYGYDIQDALTGDSKNQKETRQGDVVQGSYSLIEPDGTRRTVEYTADPHNGFNAVVHREPAVQKAIVAAPARTIASPLGYSTYH